MVVMNTSTGMTMAPGSPMTAEKAQAIANQTKNQQAAQQQQAVLMQQQAVHQQQQQQAIQQLQFQQQGQQHQQIQPKSILSKFRVERCSSEVCENDASSFL